MTTIGFASGQIQTPEVSDRIAWIFGPGVNAFFLVGALIVLGLKYTDQKHAQVLRLLRK